jgi:hypothetical protein
VNHPFRQHECKLIVLSFKKADGGITDGSRLEIDIDVMVNLPYLVPSGFFSGLFVLFTKAGIRNKSKIHPNKKPPHVTK